MRKIHLLGLFFIILFIFNGCAPTLPTLAQPFRAWVKTWEIKVTSEPSGTDAYVNGAFIGTTPASTSLTVYYNTLGVPEDQPPKILVVKQGYQAEGTTLGIPDAAGGSERITLKFTLVEEGSPNKGYVSIINSPECVGKGEVVEIKVSGDLATESLKETIETVTKHAGQANKPELNDKTSKER